MLNIQIQYRKVAEECFQNKQQRVNNSSIKKTKQKYKMLKSFYEYQIPEGGTENFNFLSMEKLRFVIEQRSKIKSKKK